MCIEIVRLAADTVERPSRTAQHTEEQTAFDMPRPADIGDFFCRSMLYVGTLDLHMALSAWWQSWTSMISPYCVD